MRTMLRELADRFRGTGAYSVTTPPMDGALKPNSAIETAPVAAYARQPDCLVELGGDVLFASGAQVFRLAEPERPLHSFASPIAAMAASPGGALAIGLNEGGIVLKGGPLDGRTFGTEVAIECPTAVLFEDEHTLVVCNGSDRNPPERWRHDLMQRNARGSVWRLRSDGSAAALAKDLAYPNGLLLQPDGALIVSESWKGRLVRIEEGKRPRTVLNDLPGYPARLCRREGGGAFLAVFAPRSQLIEFVLSERGYCEAMMRDVPEAFWIAPSLNAPSSVLEPMQGGGLKQLGTLKPWAPARSFGLVVALDTALRPVASWHSRADGVRHGVTSCLQRRDGSLLVAAKGADTIVSIDPGEETAR